MSYQFCMHHACMHVCSPRELQTLLLNTIKSNYSILKSTYEPMSCARSEVSSGIFKKPGIYRSFSLQVINRRETPRFRIAIAVAMILKRFHKFLGNKKYIFQQLNDGCFFHFMGFLPIEVGFYERLAPTYHGTCTLGVKQCMPSDPRLFVWRGVSSLAMRSYIVFFSLFKSKSRTC